MGDNSSGQCDVPAPNADFVAVVGGGSHSLGLKSDGSIVAWGYNQYGQCNVPVPNADFVAVAAGAHHSLGLRRLPTRTVEIAVDIRPGSCPNPFNTTPFENTRENANAKKGGVLPVAILGTATFDVSEIDVSTVRLEGLEPLRYDYEDVASPVVDGDECECTTAGPDGRVDLTLKFQKSEVVAALGPLSRGDVVPLTLTGQLEGGTLFEGTDCVTIITGEPEGREFFSDEVMLQPAVPNPFNPTTTISFVVPEKVRTTLVIFDVQGRHVATLLDDVLDPGFKAYTWDAKDVNGTQVSTGVYFYRLTAGDRTLTKKMILLK